MSKRYEILYCTVCGAQIEVLHGGAGALVCCGAPMQLLTENTVDASREKHVPVAERNGEALTVRVGSVPHPMEEKHFIEWIEVIADGVVTRRYLKPGDEPVATVPAAASSVTVREYCTLHGLWSATA